MSLQVPTFAGGELFIASTAQNDDLTEQEFQNLSYTQVKGISTVGEHGIQTSFNSLTLWDTKLVIKGKGTSEGGEPNVEAARFPDDPGQQAMDAAGAPHNGDNYALKYVLTDGRVRYMRGLVAGPQFGGGANEDFDMVTWGLALNQEVIESSDAST